MNIQQIDRVIRWHVLRFDGIYRIDTLPWHGGPKLLVANTDLAGHPGEHYIAILFDDRGNGQYFDSFGCAPSKRFDDYMNRYCRSWTYNIMQFQSATSELCGDYCIVWCLLNSGKIDLCNLLSSSDTGLNDSPIRSIISRMMHAWQTIVSLLLFEQMLSCEVLIAYTGQNNHIVRMMMMMIISRMLLRLSKRHDMMMKKKRFYSFHSTYK